jgi:hypothetical protein
MTSSFTPSNWDELVSLRRECLALRLTNAQLTDVIKQREGVLTRIAAAQDCEHCSTLAGDAIGTVSATPHPTPSGASQGQPGGSAGGVGELVDHPDHPVRRAVVALAEMMLEDEEVRRESRHLGREFYRGAFYDQGVPKAFSQESDT